MNREEIIKWLKSLKAEIGKSEHRTLWHYAEAIDMAIEALTKLQGEWIKHKGEWIDCDFYPTKYECSQCHYYVDEGYDSIFCPNCGAKMKSEKEYLDKTFPGHDGGEWLDITDRMTRESEEWQEEEKAK